MSGAGRSGEYEGGTTVMQPEQGQSRWAPGARLGPSNGWAAARGPTRTDAITKSAGHRGANAAPCFAAMLFVSTATLLPVQI